MNLKTNSAPAQLFLRLALGVDYLVLGLDRLGAWGPNGHANVSWGDWAHFSAYAHQVMSFLPARPAEILAILATAGELSFGFLLLIGWLTKWAAIGSGILSFCFACAMTISFGISSPINYSVFVVSAGSFLLSTLQDYKWSIDQLIAKKKRGYS